MKTNVKWILVTALLVIVGATAVYAGNKQNLDVVSSSVKRANQETIIKNLKITSEKAKEIALTNAGVKAEDVTFVKVNLDSDDGVYVYDIEFYVNGTEYEYEINADNGNILSVDKDFDKISNATDLNLKIIEEKAKEIALTNAGVKAKDATFMKVNLDRDDGIYVYEIKFYADNAEYEYKINAVDGSVLDFEKDIHNVIDNQNVKITLEKAKEIALTNAGVKLENATFVKVKLDKDNGIYVYEVKFYVNGIKYEYDVNAIDGSIIDIDKDNKNINITTNNTQNAKITLEKAKEIALKHAGIKSENAVFKKAKLDKDDGIYVYEIEFYVGNMEYEYEIDANNGNILDFDRDDD